MTINIKKYMFPILLLLVAAFLTACGSNDKKETIKIGYQKNGVTLLLKDKKELEKELNDLGYKVEWSEFNTGSSIMEALNAGSIDFANASDAPSLIALSKGMKFKYIAGDMNAPNTEGILVHGDSNIKSVADLKGKKVAYNQASISQFLLFKVLEKEGLSLENDVESVILNPPDASLAFEKKNVDAWVIWDPYMTVSEAKGNKILTTGEGYVSHRSFYMTSVEMSENHSDIVEIVFKHIQNTSQQVTKDPAEAAEILEENTDIPKETWVASLQKKNSDADLLNESVINDLTLYSKDLVTTGITDTAVNVNDFVWQPE